MHESCQLAKLSWRVHYLVRCMLVELGGEKHVKLSNEQNLSYLEELLHGVRVICIRPADECLKRGKGSLNDHARERHSYLEVSIETLLSLFELTWILHSEERLAWKNGEVRVELLQVLVEIIELFEALLQLPLVRVSLHNFNDVDDLRIVNLTELPLDDRGLSSHQGRSTYRGRGGEPVNCLRR